MNFFFLFCLFILSIIVHEWGHIIVYRKLGINPNVKFKWYAIEVSHPMAWKFTPMEYMVMLIVGVIIGLPLVMHNIYMLILYLFLSSGDLLNIYQMFEHRKRKESIIEIHREELANAEIEIRDYENDLNKTLSETAKEFKGNPWDLMK